MTVTLKLEMLVTFPWIQPQSSANVSSRMFISFSPSNKTQRSNTHIFIMLHWCEMRYVLVFHRPLSYWFHLSEPSTMNLFSQALKCLLWVKYCFVQFEKCCVCASVSGYMGIHFPYSRGEGSSTNRIVLFFVTTCNLCVHFIWEPFSKLF